MERAGHCLNEKEGGVMSERETIQKMLDMAEENARMWSRQVDEKHAQWLSAMGAHDRALQTVEQLKKHLESL